MSATNTVNDEINAISKIEVNFVKYWCYIMIIFGLIGHTMSLLVFTRPALRSNPCSRYLLASTMVGFCVVTNNILVRFLQIVYQIDTFIISISVCKLFGFLFMWFR